MSATIPKRMLRALVAVVFDFSVELLALSVFLVPVALRFVSVLG